jgi:hypothetical protein
VGPKKRGKLKINLCFLSFEIIVKKNFQKKIQKFLGREKILKNLFLDS